MVRTWLKAINVLTIPIILVLAAFFWIFVPKEQLMWCVVLTILILLMVLYLNVLTWIKDRKAAESRPLDIGFERLMKVMNYISLAAIIALGLYAGYLWITYSPGHSLIIAILTLLFILGVSEINVIAGLKNERRMKFFTYIAVILILAIGVFAWMMLPREQFTWAVIFMAICLFPVVGVNVIRAFSGPS